MRSAWRDAAGEVEQREAEKALSFFAVGVEGANFDILKQIAVREPLKLQGLRFRDLFVWLSASQKAVSRSQHGDKVPLPPVDWGTVES